MKTKSIVLLAMALGCGLVAMLGVQQILSGEQKVKETVPVLVVKQEISGGVKLDAANVAFEQWPRENVPLGAVTEASQYEERALKSKAYPGDVVMQSKLGEKGQFGISTMIPPGMRLASIPVNMTMVHSGMIRAHDRIDVLCTYTQKQKGGSEVSRTKTVLEYIEVFAIDRNREGEGAGANDAAKGAKAENLSVLVTPEQAHVLNLANAKGKIQISLRNTEDKAEAHVSAVDDKIFDDLLATKGSDKEEFEPKPVVEAKPVVQEPVKPADPTNESWTITIFEGDKKRDETIKLPISKSKAAEPAAAEPDAAQPTAAEPAEELETDLTAVEAG
ncbi:MAG: Flp pilus assembly protein CpaB [Planctomycetia bacterium]|nr:Flp pilus assembly protein CpaB [Planctomycetia bacterium]